MVDKIGEKTALLGVPGLVLLAALEVFGWVKIVIVAILVAVVAGPLGTVLGAAIVFAKVLTEVYDVEKIFSSAVTVLNDKGISADDIKQKTEALPVFLEVKSQISCWLEAMNPKSDSKKETGEKKSGATKKKE